MNLKSDGTKTTHTLYDFFAILYINILLSNVSLSNVPVIWKLLFVWLWLNFQINISNNKLADGRIQFTIYFQNLSQGPKKSRQNIFTVRHYFQENIFSSTTLETYSNYYLSVLCCIPSPVSTYVQCSSKKKIQESTQNIVTMHW